MIKIENLYGDLCNFYGDQFNIKYLESCSDEIEIIKSSILDVPYFVNNDVDMIYLGSTSEKRQEIIIEKLKNYKERIIELINKGVVFLITGNSLEIFGSRIENEDGTYVDGLNIFNTVAKRKMLERHNSLFTGEIDGITILGFKSQFAFSYGDNSDCYAFKIIKGVGLSPESKYEGIRINNFIATYLLGPILLLNPDFTKYLLELLGVKNVDVKYYDVAKEAFEVRKKEFEKFNIQ